MNRVTPDFTEVPLHVAATTARRTHRSASDRAATRPGQDDSLDQSTEDSSQRVEMYDPYDPASSDSEYEKNHNNSPPDQDYNPGQQCSSPSRDFRKKRRWASCYSDSVTVHDRSPETTQSDRLSPGHRLPERPVYSLHGEDQPGYDSISRPLAILERLIHASSSTQQFPVSYGQRADGEERNTFTEYKREMNATVGSSPTRLQPDYQQLNYLGTEWDQVPPSTKVPRNRSINVIMDKSPIMCDLCDVELANGQELEDHLESKSHWDTLEHIQQQHHYDDMAIAFLQEVMLYKSQQCSRAIEDGAVQALQENDHMTKIEMFQCAACRALVSTSASSVHIHITSQEHLTNIKEFQVQQRRSCLDKAETMMKELKPQFEHFLKGGSPFE
ncbi:DBIRD complex subunit ZNF326 [Liparis tanakae]|uniref:DBIRD complex subunit ZNF326 n=1 Tax=Liparis tanakae TaxID=230148 RepID=A0A4Z2HW69_9TELE|nr:DBIRD complex subunit ZNF326 [Liparis tanakae]